MVEVATTDLPGEPEHFQQHEIEEPEVDAEIIDAMLKPYVDKLPMVSDERDIDEDFEEEIVFKEPIIGGSAALLAHRKVKPSANKIHAVEFKLDGSGVVNVLTSDVTRDPSKLELRLESTTEGSSGPIIMRHYDLNDDEMQKQLERELYMEELSPEARLRAGDPSSSVEVISKKKAVPTPPPKPKGSVGQVSQLIGDTVSQFLKPPTRDQGTMIAPKMPPPPPVKTRTSIGTSPKPTPPASPKPSPPPTPRSGAGTPPSAKKDLPPLPAEAADPKTHTASGLPYKAPPGYLLGKASPRAPPQKKSSAPASSSTEPAAKIAKTDPPVAKAPPPGTDGPVPSSGAAERPEGYPNWYHFSSGTSEPNVYTIRCNELPGLKDIGHLAYDDLRLAKRISGLLRGYEHKDLQPHHRHIPPDFDADLKLNFEGMYGFLKKRFRFTLSREDLYLFLKTQDRFMCDIEAGKVGQLSTLNMPYKILRVRACQGTTRA